jgi:hypothetical protein
VLILDMIEVLPTMGKYKYDTWRILPVKCYIDNSVCLRSCIWNVNGHQSHGGVLSVRLARPPCRRIGSSLLFTPLPIVGVTRGAYNGSNAHHRGWRTGEGDQRGGVNGSQSKFLKGTWPISWSRPVSYPVLRKKEWSLHMCAQDVQITRMATIW